MKLRYKKNTIVLYTILAVVWSFLVVTVWLDAPDDNDFIQKYGYAIVAILNILILYVFGFKGYGSVENGILSRFGLPSKKINLSEVTEVININDEYIFRTASKKLKFNRKQVNEEDWEAFIQLPIITELISTES